MFDEYTRWAKFETKRHLDAFQRDKFYNTVTNSLLACDMAFKPAMHIRFETCDRFMQGAYLPE